MEDLLGKIDCRSKYDSIVMRLLRSAMDKAHEQVQNMNGPMEFLHERSKFYDFASILVEAGLNIVEEEPDIHESNRDKIVSDLMEIKNWLHGRNEEMKTLIIEKDKELMESSENELRLKHALELNERELVYLRDKLEVERTKSNRIHDFLQSNRDNIQEEDEAKAGDQQVLDMKQKLEMERRRKSLSNVSDSEVYLRIFDEDRSPGARSVEDELHRHDHFFDIRPSSRTFKPGKNNKMVQQMSCDIAILKKTLGLAFGRMQNAKVLPLENQWRWNIEKDTILDVTRGFVMDIQHILNAELKKRGAQIVECVAREKLTDDLRSLRDELNALRDENMVSVKSSEPLLNGAAAEEAEEHVDYVATMIKNHKRIMQKHQEEKNWLAKEILLWKGSSDFTNGTKSDELDSKILKRITRLDNLIACYDDQIDEENVRDEIKFPPSAVHEQLRDVIRDGNGRLSFVDSTDYERTIEGKLDELEESTSLEIPVEYLEKSIRNEIYAVYLQETVKQWKKNLEYNADNSLLKKHLRELPYDELRKGITYNSNLLIRESKVEAFERRKADIPCGSVFEESMERLIREDIYLVYFRNMSSEWRTKKEECELEMIIRENIYQLALVEQTREAHKMVRDLQSLDKLDIHVRESLIDKTHAFLNYYKKEGHLIANGAQSHESFKFENACVNGTARSDNFDTAAHLLHTMKVILSKTKHGYGVAPDPQQLVDHSEQQDSGLAAGIRRKLSCSPQAVKEAFVQDHCVSSELVGFEQRISEFERLVHKKLDEKSLRMEELKNQVARLAQSLVSIRQSKMLYKKAFFNRCINLQLAENEVDLLGNQVDKLLSLLHNIYLVLSKNARVLPINVELSETLNLIKTELAVLTCFCNTGN